MYHPISTTSPDLLAEWRWLLGGHPRCCGWSSAGDLFYADATGQICRLDTGAAESEIVAASQAAFAETLEDSTRVEEMLLLPLVRAFEQLYGPLHENQCLGVRTLPVLGGAYTIENRYAVPATEHAAFTGEIHRQIGDLPDGPTLRFRVVP